jgi:hypothetical protein
MAIITMAIVIGVVGGTKLYLGVTRSRPILFLVILLVLLIALYTKKKAYQLILVLLTP